MAKRFRLEHGYLGRVGSCWYDHRVRLVLAEHEELRVYRRSRMGKVGACVGTYVYADLDPLQMPSGLYWEEVPEQMAMPLSVVGSARG